MLYPEITELFSYYRNPNYCLEVLKKKEIYLSAPESFNDPFDCCMPYNSEITEECVAFGLIKKNKKQGLIHIKSVLDETFTEDFKFADEKLPLIEEIKNDFQKYATETNIYCLTEDPLSILMWSHYGMKHQGICLGFKRTPHNTLGDDDICSPILYSDFFPHPAIEEGFDRPGAFSQSFFYTKARNWEYEREWRLLAERQDGATWAPLPGDISCIILGYKFDREFAPDFLATLLEYYNCVKYIDSHEAEEAIWEKISNPSPLNPESDESNPSSSSGAKNQNDTAENGRNESQQTGTVALQRVLPVPNAYKLKLTTLAQLVPR